MLSLRQYLEDEAELRVEQPRVCVDLDAPRREAREAQSAGAVVPQHSWAAPTGWGELTWFSVGRSPPPGPYAGGLRKTLQAWKQRVKGQGSLPFRTKRSLRGRVGSLERMCWM